MPIAPVDTRGSVLYYEDSGVPNASTDYVTLVMVHGTCFHSGEALLCAAICLTLTCILQLGSAP